MSWAKEIREGMSGNGFIYLLTPGGRQFALAVDQIDSVFEPERWQESHPLVQVWHERVGLSWFQNLLVRFSFISDGWYTYERESGLIDKAGHTQINMRNGDKGTTSEDFDDVMRKIHEARQGRFQPVVVPPKGEDDV